MRKLKLDIDSLAVQTFETDEAARKRGTVQAHDSLASTGGPWFCPAACETDFPTNREVSCDPDA
jgi:hypothetical protein